MKEPKRNPGIERLDLLIWGDSSIRVMEEVLEEVFCRPGKEVVLSLLKNNYGIEKKDIPRRPEVFQMMLKDFFGDGGRVIESMIVQKIMYKKVELKEGVRHG